MTYIFELLLLSSAFGSVDFSKAIAVPPKHYSIEFHHVGSISVGGDKYSWHLGGSYRGQLGVIIASGRLSSI